MELLVGLRLLHFLLTLTPAIASPSPDSHGCDSPVTRGSTPCLLRPYSRQLPKSPRLHTHGAIFLILWE